MVVVEMVWVCIWVLVCSCMRGMGFVGKRKPGVAGDGMAEKDGERVWARALWRRGEVGSFRATVRERLWDGGVPDAGLG